MMNDKIKLFFKKPLILIAIIVLVSCWDRPLLTELATNRIEVRIMGTFSSDGSEEWDLSDWSLINDDSITENIFLMDDDYPELFMLDLAEMRLSRKQKRGAKFSIYRQTFRIPLNTNNSSQHDFFNGKGIVLKNDDVPQDREYHWVRLYIRKMVFDKAYRYHFDDRESNLLRAGIPERVTFHERRVDGFDFNLQQLNSRYDLLKRNYLAINRIFPLDIPIVGGLIFDNDNEKTVLEVRLNLKNYIKKYELIGTNEDNEPYIAHYFAFSDGLRDVLHGDAMIGGNIMAIARTYVPKETGNIESGSITSGGSGYVIAIPEGDEIADYIVPENYRKTYLNKWEKPELPFRQGQERTIASAMNYYLKSENYKYRWNSFMANLKEGDVENDEAQLVFEEAWAAFDEAVNFYKMPLLATRVYDDVEFSFKNVTPGEYDVYRIYWTDSEGNELSNGYGMLPNVFEALGTVTVEIGETGLVQPIENQRRTRD